MVNWHVADASPPRVHILYTVLTQHSLLQYILVFTIFYSPFATMGDLTATNVDIPRHTLLDEILSQQKQPLSEIVSRITYVARFCDQATAHSATRAYGAIGQLAGSLLARGRLYERD